MTRLAPFALLACLGCNASSGTSGMGTGSDSGGSPAGIAAARPRLEQWVASSWLAYDTRTHATDQSPRAQADADRIEAELKKAHPADVRVALRDRRASAKGARDAAEQRRNSIMVAGRAHTENDKAELQRLDESIKRFEKEDAMLAELGRRLGL